MISSIIIEALARRAKSVIDNHPSMERNVGPTVPEFHAAFVDELKRFENVELDNSATVPPKPVRAKLFSDPATRPSRGVGLGQRTGGTAQSDADEAKRILKMLAPGESRQEFAEALSRKENTFLHEQMLASLFPLYSVTGKQLFWLREIKDKLIERGLI